VRKKIFISAPIFDTPSGPSGPGGMLYKSFKSEGYIVFKRSNKRNRLLRVFDTFMFILLNFWRYDIVIVHVFSYKAFILSSFVILINKILGKNVIAVINGGAFPEFICKYTFYVNFVLTKCNVISSPSKYIIQELKRYHLKILYTPNFINNEIFKYNWSTNNNYNLLWVRAFHKIYNPQIAIICVARLKNIFPNIHLTMIGPDQGELNAMLKLINHFSLENNIDVIGPKPNHDLHKYYTSHNVFLTTTSYESFGVAMVEAANCGIPMVATNVGEIPLLWENGKELLIADVNNQEEFNEHVKKLLLDKEFAQKLSYNAFEKAKKFTWQSVKSKWELLLHA
jgi:glycosyltransferase involved in cell wall biosynthesis